MKKYSYKLAMITAAIFLVSCGDSVQKVAEDNAPVIEVNVNKVQTNDNGQFLSVSGKIIAAKSADISTRMMGYVDRVYVNVGDKVSKGQLLVSINSADLQAKKAQVDAGIDQATTAFKNAEKNYNRFKNLYASNSVTQKEMDDMKANYQMTKAGLESVKQLKNEVLAQLNYSNITAPFAGVITSNNIEAGDMANPGVSLMTVETAKKFEVNAMVPETEISNIKKGANVEVLVKSANKTLQGKVTEINTSSKHTGGQYLVKIALQKTDANILSGMFATVQFPQETKEASVMVLIPLQAIVKNGQLSGVYTVSQSNTAILRWLRLGRTFNERVEVLSGLSEGESYIIASKGKLFNGAKILIQ
tara:strand:- start:1496 stop:2575 length:1080 start_codon:yes stop_codon:yes gene_type:complete